MLTFSSSNVLGFPSWTALVGKLSANHFFEQGQRGFIKNLHKFDPTNQFMQRLKKAVKTGHFMNNMKH